MVAVSSIVARTGKGLCLYDLFEQQAARTPDARALVCEEKSLSYRELSERAERLAHRLRRMGAGPDVIVALLIDRSLETIVGILGILKAGAAYLPIDPAFPPARIAFMLADAGVSLVVTQSAFLPALPTGSLRALCLDRLDWSAAPHPAPDAVRFHPGNLAYVIYTSGSTGRPKGVCIEHRSIVDYVLGVAERLQFEAGMQHATVSTIAADLGNTVIFPALATGGCLHVISQERAEDQELLAEYFGRERIDVLKIVPSHLAALQTGSHPERVMPARCLVLGGEASRLDWVERLRALAPRCAIHNHYGPTETTVGVLTYPVGAKLPATQSGTLLLGRPLPHCRVHILDAGGQPAPAGERGELCIGGSGVARGYLNRPELDAEKFVAEPPPARTGARMYRTGDLARRLADGNIEFCGRIDDQIKVNGNRVELGEIEGALREHSGVRHAVVLAGADGAGPQQLVAYVVPNRPDQPLWANDLVHLLPDGSPVAHLNRNETDYIYHEIFVLQAYLRHGISIDDGDCVVDAGANIGLFTVFASRLARDLRLLAFEPNPAAFACLRTNADAWGAAVKCLPLGLSHENKAADLTFFRGLSLLSGFYADAAVEREVVKTFVLNQQPDLPRGALPEADVAALLDERLQSKTVSAQLRTLSSVLAQEGVERIDLLKINVEKSELDVLLGISAADWPRIRQMVIEVDQQANLTPITALLLQHGFEYLVEQDALLKDTALCYVYAIRPSARSRLIRQQAPGAHLRRLPATSDTILAPAVLRQHLTQRLPKYMMPSAFVLMDKFPLTANGKIDRHAFPAFAFDKPRPVPAELAPRSATEKALAAIWADLLKLEQVGLDEDFFDLGGHSLLAIRAVARIRERFASNLSLRNFLETPTVAGLARVIDGLSWLTQSKAAAEDSGSREEIEL